MTVKTTLTTMNENRNSITKKKKKNTSTIHYYNIIKKTVIHKYDDIFYISILYTCILIKVNKKNAIESTL